VGLITLAEELDRRQAGQLLVFGDRHPAFHGGTTEELMKRLGRSPRVVQAGQVAHDQLVDAYTRAHVAIDLMKGNAERELAFTTRTAEYLWCGLPVIYNDYAELAEHIREYQAGWTVDPEDTESIREVIDSIFERPESVEERSRNAQRLVRDRLTWDHTIAPVDRFVRNPSMRRDQTVADRVSALMPAEVTLMVQRARSKLSPAADRRLRRLLAFVGRTKGLPDDSGDAPIPLELALIVNRASRTLPLPAARRAKELLRRVAR
jgi:hypothetical protein